MAHPGYSLAQVHSFRRSVSAAAMGRIPAPIAALARKGEVQAATQRLWKTPARENSALNLKHG